LFVLSFISMELRVFYFVFRFIVKRAFTSNATW
jgi:hypothetical protein